MYNYYIITVLALCLLHNILFCVADNKCSGNK